MIRMLPSALAFALVVSPAIVQLTGQTPVRDPGQPNQPNQPNMPTERRVPVGTSSVTGTVTTADGGRPVRGARVSLNGAMVMPLARAGGAGPAAPSSAGPGSGMTGLAGGVVGGRGRGEVTFTGGYTSANRATTTDAQGNFSFEHLPAGQYSANVSRTGFLPTNFGQKRPGGTGTTFTIAEGQKTTISLQLLRGGVISGTVFGEDGDPIRNTQVSVWRFTMQNGVKRLNQQGGSSTDDRGMYRLHGLQPGEYLVSATTYNYDGMNNDRMMADMVAIERAIASGAIQPPAAPGQPATVAIPVAQPVPAGMPREQPPGFLPVYYPGTPVPAEGTVVKVAGGDEHPNVDIQLRMVQASAIQGTVTNIPGAGLAVQLALVNDDPMFSNQMSTRVDDGGNFTFRNVAPGKYTVVAQVVASPNYTVVNGVSTQPTPPTALTDGQKLWGRTVVTVEGQPSVDASIALRRGRTISGQVIFDMQRPPDVTRSKWMVTLQQAPGVQMPMYGPAPQAEVGPDGRFTLTAVPAGLYQLRAGGSIKSVMVNGEDILDFPLNFPATRDITDVMMTVTDKFTEIEGTLTDSAGKPVTEYSVVAVTEETRFWTPGSRRVALMRPAPDGRYSIRNLPPGTYLLAAVTDIEYGGQYDLDFLKSIVATSSMRVTVTEGGRVSQDLRIGR